MANHPDNVLPHGDLAMEPAHPPRIRELLADDHDSALARYRRLVHIDSFILSCRAMGRAIESAVLNEIKKLCFARAACLAITAEFIPTAKNMPVRELYEEHGFSVLSVDASLHKHYRLDRNSSSLSACEWIAFNHE